MTKCYKVYMHIFPNGKKYIESTCADLQQRWNNGRGYYFQNEIFDAICKYGWNNINHYLLFDGLSRNDASLIENALIVKYQTYKQRYGYNRKVLSVPKDFIVPVYKKKKIICKDVVGAVPELNTWRKSRSGVSKSVKILETDEVFDSVSDGARAFMITPAAISYAIRNNNGYCCGYHWQYVE